MGLKDDIGKVLSTPRRTGDVELSGYSKYSKQSKTLAPLGKLEVMRRAPLPHKKLKPIKAGRLQKIMGKR